MLRLPPAGSLPGLLPEAELPPHGSIYYVPPGYKCLWFSVPLDS